MASRSLSSPPGTRGDVREAACGDSRGESTEPDAAILSSGRAPIMRSSSEPSRYAQRGDLSEQLLDGQLLGDQRVADDARLGGDRGDGP